MEAASRISALFRTTSPVADVVPDVVGVEVGGGVAIGEGVAVGFGVGVGGGERDSSSQHPVVNKETVSVAASKSLDERERREESMTVERSGRDDKGLSLRAAEMQDIMIYSKGRRLIC
jgi:hypothetical protein